MKPHKHAELIKAWADGAEIQLWWADQWVDSENPNWGGETYRIKPEPKTDVVRFLNQLTPQIGLANCWEESNYEVTKTRIKLTFDGETGELKSAEVLK